MFKLLAVVLFASAGAFAFTTCTNYCGLMVQANCTGASSPGLRAQYADFGSCMNSCTNAGWVNGSVSDTSGNTLGCRLYHAYFANMSGDASHCAHAGFSGGGACGTYAENYCHFSTKCGSPNGALAGCPTVAGKYAVGSPITYPEAQGGNTMSCRLYHYFVAFSGTSIAADHCGHGSFASVGGLCGDTDEGACTAVTGSCTGAQSGYSGVLANCSAYGVNNVFPEGALTATSGDSASCRTYHAVVAATPANAAVHCPHAGPSGGSACGSVCETYCRLFQTNCQNVPNVTGYATLQACTAACGAFPVGSFDDTAGNTAYCRVYHAGVSGYSPALAEVHCFHAQQNPTAACVAAPAPATTGGDDNKDGSGASMVAASIVVAAGSVFATMF